MVWSLLDSGVKLFLRRKAGVLESGRGLFCPGRRGGGERGSLKGLRRSERKGRRRRRRHREEEKIVEVKEDEVEEEEEREKEVEK